MNIMNENLNIPKKIQGIIDAIENTDLYLAELPLSEHPKLSDFNRSIQVIDIDIKSNQQFIYFKYEQVLRHKASGERLNISLPAPEWVIYPDTWSYLRDENNNAIKANVKDSEEENFIAVPTYKYIVWLIKNSKADFISLLENYLSVFINENKEKLDEL